jgi:alpha-N-acetylglucosamine transferase
MVRMHATSKLTELPDRDALLLTKMGVKIRYLPLDSLDSFYSAMLAKFFILDYTEYDRIIFMDSDLIPLCNLDYLYQLSMEGSIGENVVLAWLHEPAAGGFFMRKAGGKEELDSVVRANR